MDSLNRRALYLLYTSNGISGFAQGVSMLAIPWYFAQQGRTSDFNAYFAAVTLFGLFWTLYAGSIVDRFPRKSVFIGNNLIEAVVVFSAAGYGFYTGRADDWMLVAVFFVTISGFQIHYPTLYAFAQEITPAEEYTGVTSQVEVIGQTTGLLAGMVGAVLLDGFSVDLLGLTVSMRAWTIWEIFLMDGVTYLISVVLILSIRYRPLRQRTVQKAPLLERLRTGFAFLRQRPSIAYFGLFSYGVFTMMLVQMHGIMPGYVAECMEGGGTALGVARLFMAFGSMSAGFLAGRLFARVSKPAAVTILTFFVTGILFAVAFNQHTWVFVGLTMGIGFSNASVRILRLSYLLECVPNAVIGRVNSVFSLSRIVLQASFIQLFTLSWFDGPAIWMAYAVLGTFTLACGTALLFYKDAQSA